VNWRVVSASEIGTSHIAAGTSCEDSCWAQVDSTADGQPFLSMFVSDGAGSAARGGEGAELAIEAAGGFITSKLRLKEFGLCDALAVECVVAIRERIYGHAETQDLKARDFACTFLGVLSSSQGTLVMQVGDGGVVVDVGSGLETAIVPMSGEYANMTNFVTDDEAVSILATKAYPVPATRVAAFSDGLQRLVLDMTTNKPYEPFFAKFFQILGNATADKEDELHGALTRFLTSSSVNDRTDDDKTLAMAVLIS
jgi:Protein phosphatase 2C